MVETPGDVAFKSEGARALSSWLPIGVGDVARSSFATALQHRSVPHWATSIEYETISTSALRARDVVGVLHVAWCWFTLAIQRQSRPAAMRFPRDWSYMTGVTICASATWPRNTIQKLAPTSSWCTSSVGTMLKPVDFSFVPLRALTLRTGHLVRVWNVTTCRCARATGHSTSPVDHPFKASLALTAWTIPSGICDLARCCLAA